MQASTFMVKGDLGFGVQNRRVAQINGFKGLSSIGCNNQSFLKVNDNNYKFNPCKLSCGSLSMGAGFGRLGIDHVMKSSAKYRSVKAQAASGDLEDATPVKYQGKPSASVLPYVGVACLGAILFGYHLGYDDYDLLLSFITGETRWVVSILLAGATVGSFTGGSLADQFGRTRTFQLDAIPLAIGAYLCATAQSVQIMMIGRLLCGIGIGISSALVPLYISEISPTDIRGALGSVNQLFICIGILAALVAGLPLAGNPLWWRTMFGIATVPSVLLALGMGFCPESPRWLFQQGKIAEAQKAVAALYGKERVPEVINDLRTSVASAGIASDVAASALVGAANVFGTAIASSLMDRQGRKSLLMTSFSGMAASMLLLSLSFTWKALAPYSGTLAVVGTVLYVLSFSLGAGPVPALLLPEIFASRIRAKAVALSLGMHWASNFVIGLYFLSVVTKFGISKVYLGFASVCVLAVLYIAGNVVETKGRSLEEIELALNPSV
uniref:Major facilitator superfamily (MFS) profile domain-containing protein n=1 Tax=Chenopodium quinoa TaxID=63459 RepID=A0A803LAX4_CHEQI